MNINIPNFMCLKNMYQCNLDYLRDTTEIKKFYKRQRSSNQMSIRREVLNMKSVTIWLLLLSCCSCLLSVKADAVHKNSLGFEELETYGLIKNIENILRKVLTTVRGVNCVVKEVVGVLSATTKYLDSIDACGTAVPKDVGKIVKSCQSIMSLCNDIINLNDTICAPDDDTEMTSSLCFLHLLEATLKLSYKIDTTIKQIVKLPGDTESCFRDATSEVRTAYENFLPNINKCIDGM